MENKGIKPVSWSEITTFERDSEEWYRRYILGLREPPTFAMIQGTDIHSLVLGGGEEALRTDKYLPKEVRCHQEIKKAIEGILEPYKMKYEHKAKIDVLGIPTLGYWDGYAKNMILELKTTSARFDSYLVSYLNQLAWYNAQHFSLTGVYPKNLLIIASTSNGKVEVEEISLDESRVLSVFERAEDFWEKIKPYRTKRLSRKDSLL